MSAKRLTAAGAVLAVVVFVATVSAATAGGPTRAPIDHTCSVTDRQFLRVAELNMTALGVWSEDYINGRAKAAEVVKEALNATKRIGATSPSDPSLAQTQTLMEAMFTEYAKAIEAKARGRDSARAIFRAYGLANLANDVLVRAQPALDQHGCDVSPLL